ncbi:4-hydroxy-tetrahydrodipicolinate synthase [Jeotgalibacillus proteolyticus]|uniref:4-hydroxy-tetrahydrodipicolinate synthase n=1 Tax=Jeotgalibacillus proteolyticus TaxID=2082395 RepID=A0A2S5GG55_9BACL|nr:4-hydroxy-tetrahydrodipicolinate synthase [Jeotgalibacillus proteolyticus]PPA72010.1 4-hydroxy-tetrahydrodipicolinate synthase [Jeotgalibacillus proteolyticus]
MNFGRVSTAMATPFTQQGAIDFEQTTKLINYLLDNGTESLVIAGTTGESPTLSSQEKIDLIKHTVNAVNGRVPVIAGTGSNNTEGSIELSKKAVEAGADAIMLVAPYYSKPSQEGLYQHFAAIAEEVDVPVMIYNIPGRSAVNILPETIIRLSLIDNITAVKEASGSLDQMTEILSNVKKDFLVYSGDDGLTLPLLAIGGHGVVSVASHVAGNEMQRMITAFEEGRFQEAAFMHQQLLPVIRALFAQPSPGPVKVALSDQGIDCGSLRLPLVPLVEAEKESLRAVLEHFSQQVNQTK